MAQSVRPDTDDVPGVLDHIGTGRTPLFVKVDAIDPLVDALRADRLSALGYDRNTTPALAALADQGVESVRESVGELAHVRRSDRGLECRS